MANRQRRQQQRESIKIPSAYRYLLLGLVLPILVFVGMVYGYNYGQPFGDFSAAVFAAIGSVIGLTIASIVIVKVALYWDRKILSQAKATRAKRSRKRNRVHMMNIANN